MQLDANTDPLLSAALRQWAFEPLVIVPLAISGIGYATGLARLWRRAGVGEGIPMWRALAFLLGWLTIVVALISPIAWASEILLSIHMTQHTLLMLVAAPLVAVGRPLLTCLWIFGDRGRQRLAKVVRGPVAVVWNIISAPLSVFLIQAAALWMWHIPSWYQAALRNEAVHALEHLAFLIAGTLFWWAMMDGRYGRRGYGLAVLYVFLTALHSSALGGLLTLAPSIWYEDYADQAVAWHLSALADQQLAGLLMWVPAGVVFMGLGLALFAAWLGEAEKRARLGLADAAARALLVCALAILAGQTTACDADAAKEAETLTGGRVPAGQIAAARYGCGSCHTIPGVISATGQVGPPLGGIAVRQYLGGRLTNTPAHLVTWIQHPRSVDPQTAMPELGVTDADAKDLAAFLYTLR